MLKNGYPAQQQINSIRFLFFKLAREKFYANIENLGIPDLVWTSGRNNDSFSNMLLKSPWLNLCNNDRHVSIEVI